MILFWLEGGPSHIDTWDPKPNSNFKPISTNVAGIRISELLPQIAKRMDKFALVRSMHTRGTDHPQATHYAMTGHEINPAMQFPSLGLHHHQGNGPAQRRASARAGAEMGPQPAVRGVFPRRISGRRLRPHVHSRPGQAGLPGHRPEPAEIGFAGGRGEPLGVPPKVVDRHYRALNDTAEHTNMDAFTAQAWKMILTPAVRDAFDLCEGIRER